MIEAAADRHVREAMALCKKRRHAGKPYPAQAMPVSLGGCPLSGTADKIVHFVRHGEAQHNRLAAEPGAIPCQMLQAVSEPNG